MALRRFVVVVTSTFFFVGYLPFMPGTFASVAAVGLFYCLRANTIVYFVCSLVIFFVGLLAGTEAEKIYAKKDPPCVVIDEILGMLLALAFLPSYSIEVVVIAFVFFRLLDTVKPYPANILQRLSGGLGIMADDLVAGIYTNIILQIVLRLAVFKAW